MHGVKPKEAENAINNQFYSLGTPRQRRITRTDKSIARAKKPYEAANLRRL